MCTRTLEDKQNVVWNLIDINGFIGFPIQCAFYDNSKEDSFIVLYFYEDMLTEKFVSSIKMLHWASMHFILNSNCPYNDDASICLEVFIRQDRDVTEEKFIVLKALAKKDNRCFTS